MTDLDIQRKEFQDLGFETRTGLNEYQEEKYWELHIIDDGQVIDLLIFDYDEEKLR